MAKQLVTSQRLAFTILGIIIRDHAKSLAMKDANSTGSDDIVAAYLHTTADVFDSLAAGRIPAEVANPEAARATTTAQSSTLDLSYINPKLSAWLQETADGLKALSLGAMPIQAEGMPSGARDVVLASPSREAIGQITDSDYGLQLQSLLNTREAPPPVPTAAKRAIEPGRMSLLKTLVATNTPAKLIELGFTVDELAAAQAEASAPPPPRAEWDR